MDEYEAQYGEDGGWEPLEMPVSDEMNGRIVKGIIDQSVVWQFVNPENDETFPAPVIMLEFALRNGETFQCALPPGPASALLSSLADHVANIWGGATGKDVIDLSDDALDKLMNDIKGNE